MPNPRSPKDVKKPEPILPGLPNERKIGEAKKPIPASPFTEADREEGRKILASDRLPKPKSQPPVKPMPADEVKTEPPRPDTVSGSPPAEEKPLLMCFDITVKEIEGQKWQGELIYGELFEYFTATGHSMDNVIQTLARKWRVKNDPTCPDQWKTMPQYQTEAAK